MTSSQRSQTAVNEDLWDDETTAWSHGVAKYQGRSATFERVTGSDCVVDNVDESLAFLHETILRCCASAIRRVDREPRSKRDAEILIAKYALGVEKQTLEEIAKARGGVSREVIRQQERQALEHLRASDFLKSDAVRAHLAWLIFNDGLILPGTGLPAVTLELLQIGRAHV